MSEQKTRLGGFFVRVTSALNRFRNTLSCYLSEKTGASFKFRIRCYTAINPVNQRFGDGYRLP